MSFTGQGIYPTTIEGIIAAVAKEIAAQVGVDPTMLTNIALATASVESGFNPNAMGDGGHSVGLFQLNDGGEGAGMSVQDRQNPYTNAGIAIKQIAAVLKQNPHMTPGDIAAAAQRPADRVGYASSVNSLMGNPSALSSGQHAVPQIGGGGAGGAGGGTGGTGSGGGSLSPNASPQQVQDWLNQQYGYIGGFFAIPELRQLFTSAALGGINPATGQYMKGGWDPATLEGALYKTQWWQSHAQGARDWALLYGTDPAEAQRKIAEQEQTIADQAGAMGLNLSHDRLQQFALDVLAYGWNPDELKKGLAGELKYDPTMAVQPGGFGQAISQLQKVAQDYMIPMSQQSISTYAQQILAGTQTPDTFTSYVQNLAAGQWPTLAKEIQAGTTPAQIFDPYRQQTANLLEVSPDQVDLMNNPQYQQMLGIADPKTGERRPMTLSEAGTYVRGLPQWSNTQQAQQQGAGLTRSLLNTLGATRI